MSGITLLASILIALAISTAEGAKHRIVGGTPAAVNEFPYQVSIRYNGGHFCGGSIITSTTILTAAHCLTSFAGRATGLTIKAGGLSRTTTESTQQIRSVSKLTSHASYSASTQSNDIAILTLSSPLIFDSSVKAIILAAAGSEQTAGTYDVATGWGTTSEGGTASGSLLKVIVAVVAQTTCAQAYGSVITSNVMCAGSDGKDTCQGDSGGPLATLDAATRTLVGVTSFGYGCARTGYPGVYTKVSAYRPWIKTNGGV